MEGGSTTWRVAMIASGALLAGVVAGTIESIGTPQTYAMVVGLAVAVPLIADGMNPDEVPTDRDRRFRLTAATVLAALAVGSVGAFALTAAAVSRSVAIGGAAGATYVAGLAARTWLSARLE